jgi:hypothetical protein
LLSDHLAQVPSDEHGGAEHRSSRPQQVWPGWRLWVEMDIAEIIFSTSELPQLLHVGASALAAAPIKNSETWPHILQRNS